MIYLDNAATTACDPEVLEAMLPYFGHSFGNASSIDHVVGNSARRAVENARETLAQLLDAKPEDVIFTSGATEANNLAMSADTSVFTTPIEHPSVLEPFKMRKSPSDNFLDIDRNGLVIAERSKSSLALAAAPLLSVIATNNETGTEQVFSNLASLAREFGGYLHLDATQAIGTRKISLRRDGVDALSISAHKINGPMGIGALVASSRFRRIIKPLQLGGGHERGFRPGTLNVPGIVGFAAAATLLLKSVNERRKKLSALREHMVKLLRAQSGIELHETVNGLTASPHILSLRFSGINGRALLAAVGEQVAFSLGSACATNKAEPSHVLVALGIDRRAITETVRLSFSPKQTFEQLEQVSSVLCNAVQQLSAFLPRS